MSQPAAQYTTPTEECDLVMKGGVTSGVVFPAAVLRLAQKYRLRCIGGASAGAIAASFAAAAEFARETGGFERLDEVSRQLGQRGFISALFQPARTTRPLLEAALALSTTQGAGAVRLLAVLLRLTKITLRYYCRDYLLGALLGLALWGFNLWAVGGSPTGWRWAFLVLFAGFIAWLVGLVRGLLALGGILQHAVPKNSFGLCNGYSNRTGPHLVMTQWLYESIQKIAGRPLKEPLTLGELEKKGVTFRMISSNLSQGRPYSLPFRNHAFLFKPEEFAALFPPEVVEWMVTHAHQSETITLTDGLCFLPPPEHLPAVVAVRMSLSFPVLISAVPLYTIRPSAWKEIRSNGNRITTAQIHQHWFSDGGISSNFPIHLFDAWLPKRPTFGITLGEYPPDAAPDLSRVKLPKPTDQPFSGVRIETLWSFFSAIWNTAQNYRDNTQAALPSYRERVVQILLKSDEGGLNLDLDPAVVNAMAGYGAVAGEQLCAEFSLPVHQWVRLQVLMGALEEQVRDFAGTLDEHAVDVPGLFSDQLTGMAAEFPYRRSNAQWRQEAQARMEALHALGRQWKQPVFTDGNAPKREAVLRITPDL